MINKSLTTGGVAKLCGVNQRTVIRWIERSQLKSYKLPGRGDNRIRPEDLLSFLKSHDMPIPDILRPVTPAANRRVLVIDDELLMTKAITRALRQAEFETASACSGFEAGALLYSYKPAVMTLDLQMPGLDGFDVLKFVRNTEQLKAQKIIVISALPKKELDKALAMGADAVLEKPIDFEALIDVVTFFAEKES